MSEMRYERQRKVIGMLGQEKLKKSAVCIVGCGGLGCPVALYMVASGVGKITLIDDDVVSLSNLHRQILFGEKDIGLPKVDVAKNKLHQLNSHVDIVTVKDRVTAVNVEQYIQRHDLIILGCDNLSTRYAVNDACCAMQIPFINASVLGDEGAITFFDIANGCYRCLFPEPPPEHVIPSPDKMGVLGASVGVIGTAAATMAIEILAGQKANYVNKIFVFDSLTLEMKSFLFSKGNDCTSCSSYHHTL